ncbi:DNA/RNA non-specific endonuclease [Actinacidiphila sp. bgisy167]|uniref:DNA/RNA non-specific endonuclease n=1 Tax=Actinacidiphila sp. bgisy167 TaxID=3413797 RepID=UPI003D7462AB
MSHRHRRQLLRAGGHCRRHRDRLVTARHGDTQDFWKLPPGRNRPRGHLAGCRIGGSGTGLRNLVPLHRAANTPTMITIENPSPTRSGAAR